MLSLKKKTLFHKYILVSWLYFYYIINSYCGLFFFSENVHDWEYGLFGFGYWVTILVMLSLGIVWGLVTISFTVFNIFGKPIETITGPLGLYLWNLLGCKYWFYEQSTLFLQIYF